MIDFNLLERAISRYQHEPYYSDYMPAEPEVDTLFDKYYCIEMTEDFYDSEPEIPRELESEWDFENPECMKIWDQLCKDYEPRRLSINNWQELYVEGNWDLTQDEVNKNAKETLIKYKYKDRIFVAEYDGDLYFYIYARDLPEMRDYQIILRPQSI